MVQVAIGLTPLERLRQALGDVSLGRTHTLEGSFPVEVKPLLDELNTVLAQNTEIVARARTQAGNLAHALKTPLKVLGNAAAAQHSVPSRLIGEQVPGSGLGLAIADDLARLYGGQVELADSPLGGLPVRLSLPAA